MTVQDLINALIKECGDLPPDLVKVQTASYRHGESWPDYDVPHVSSMGDDINSFGVIIS